MEKYFGISDERLKPIVKFIEKNPNGVYSFELERHFNQTRHQLWSKMVMLHKLNIIENHSNNIRKSGLRGRIYWKLKNLNGTGGFDGN